MIELIILDVDGVMTDGRKYYGKDGTPFGKTYCDKDFTAIKRFKGSGVPVCFLSGDENINKEMAKNRKVPFYSARGKDKVSFIPQLSQDFKAKPENMVYVGDDLFDLSIMKAVGHPYCPSDSSRELITYCNSNFNFMKSVGGDNVVAELFYILLDKRLVNDCTMQDIENLDKQEIF
tara:strand:+ start:920 stop:1447 length:528 start_codon:yes stop_codon:yes gene_type:complete